MRKTVCLLFLCVSIGYAQEVAYLESGKKLNYKASRNTPVEEKLLSKEDFKPSNGRMLVTEIPCKIRNEDVANTILVSVICQQKAFNDLGVDKINEMILFANKKVTNSVMIGQRYSPTEIKMAYNPEARDWSMTHLFNVEENNAVKTNLLSFDFDAAGNFKVMKRILIRSEDCHLTES